MNARPFTGPGAFFVCDACDGSGEIIVDATTPFAREPAERAEPCVFCEGFGSIWIADADDPEVEA